MPASVINATSSPAARRSTSCAGAHRSLCSDKLRSGFLISKRFQQHPGMAGVFSRTITSMI